MSQQLPSVEAPPPYFANVVSEPQPLDPDRPVWGPLAGVLALIGSFAALLIIPLIALLAYIVAQMASGVKIPMEQEELRAWLLRPTPAFIQAVTTFPAHLATLGICWGIVSGWGKRPFFESLGWRWRTGSVIGKSGFVVGFVALMIGVEYVLGAVMPDPDDTAFKQFLRSSEAVRVCIALVAVLTAPIVEEVVYRGVLFSALRPRVGAASAVAIVTGLFAAIHFPQYWGAWSSIATVTLLSLGLTIVRARTRSLLPCFAIHTLFNVIGAAGILLTKWE